MTGDGEERVEAPPAARPEPYRDLGPRPGPARPCKDPVG